MRLAITTQLTVFYDVPEDGDNIAELINNIENGIQFLVDEGMITEGVEDAEYLSFETAFTSEFIVLLTAADHLDDIKDDLRSLGRCTAFTDGMILSIAVDQGLVDANGMYDPSEAARRHARNIMEAGQ